MKKLLLILALLPCMEPTLRAAKPNVLLIISDDQGYGDFGFNGNKLVQTPNLDRLASASAVYRNFIVAAACSPTRCALFTGRDHLLTGVWGVPPRANLRVDEARMPAFFKAAGYRTLHVGKHDCVTVNKDSPGKFGWDDWLTGGGYQHLDPMLFGKGSSKKGQGWTCDIWTDYALKFISEKKEQPWFLSLAYFIPHMPWKCDAKYSAPFLAKGCSASLAECYGSIAHMDECIGRLLDAVKGTGQEENTIIAFVSDNGQTGPEVKRPDRDPHAYIHGEDWDKRNVAHLRGYKARVFENGIRVPFLLSWPGHVTAGAREQLGGAEDVLPTLVELAGISPDAVTHQPWTGVSLVPSLRQPGLIQPRPALFRMAISGDGSPKEEAPTVQDRRFEDHHLILRGPRFKYHSLPRGKAALYDLQSDPGEVTDVQAQHPDITRSMAVECRQRWDSVIASGRSFAPLPAGQEKTKADE